MVEKNKIKIAVTGSAGSGKSLVCDLLAKKGLTCLNCDHIARQVVEPGQPGLEGLIDLFGSKILLDDGCLDRKKLRLILLDKPGAKKQIEGVLHPLIRDKMHTLIEESFRKCQQKAVVVEVPLLYESGLDTLFDICIVVTAPEKDLIARISSRDDVAVDDAAKLLNVQMDQNEKAKRADYVLVNADSMSELAESVDYIFDEIRKEFLTI